MSQVALEREGRRKDREVIEWLDGSYTPASRDLPAHLRDAALARADYRCAACGWSRRHPVTGNWVLDIDHVDGNHSNHHVSNIKVLCPNCHRLTPTYGHISVY